MRTCSLTVTALQKSSLSPAVNHSISENRAEPAFIGMGELGPRSGPRTCAGPSASEPLRYTLFFSVMGQICGFLWTAKCKMDLASGSWLRPLTLPTEGSALTEKPHEISF